MSWDLLSAAAFDTAGLAGTDPYFPAGWFGTIEGSACRVQTVSGRDILTTSGPMYDAFGALGDVGAGIAFRCGSPRQRATVRIYGSASGNPPVGSLVIGLVENFSDAADCLVISFGLTATHFSLTCTRLYNDLTSEPATASSGSFTIPGDNLVTIEINETRIAVTDSSSASLGSPLALVSAAPVGALFGLLVPDDDLSGWDGVVALETERDGIWVRSESLGGFFGDSFQADLGPYTGEWPPKAPAIRLGSTPDTDVGLVTEIDLAVGLPNPNGDPTAAFDLSYPTDLYDAYRFRTRPIVWQTDPASGYRFGDFAYGTGTQVADFEDSPGGGPGDFSAAPPGAHLFVVWYWGSSINDALVPGFTPALDPKAIAPAGYAVGATGPVTPDPDPGSWSADQLGDHDWLFPAHSTSMVYRQVSDVTTTGNANVATEAVAAFDSAIRADGLASVRETDPFDRWNGISTAKGWDGTAANRRRVLVRAKQYSTGWDFGNIDLYQPVPYPPGLLALHENLDYALPPAAFGDGFDTGDVNYDSSIADFEGFEDSLAFGNVRHEWWNRQLANVGSVGTGYPISSGTSAMAMRISYLEGPLPIYPAIETASMKWQDWDEGTILQTVPAEDVSGAIDGHQVDVFPGTSLPLQDHGAIEACGVEVTVHHDALEIGSGILVRLSLLPTSVRSFAINFKPEILDPAWTPPLTDYPMASTTHRNDQNLSMDWLMSGSGIGEGPMARFALPTYRYWIPGSAPPPPPVARQHPLRLHQRDDGLGSAGSTPRLAGSTAASPPTSKQLGRVPRIGNPNRYS